MTDAIPSAGAISRSSVARVGVATVLSALCGYIVLYLAARDLAPAGFSLFSVFWGAFGLFTGAAFGLLQEATREVRSVRDSGPVTEPHTLPMRAAALVAISAALLIGGTSALWAPHVFAASEALSVLLLAVGLAGFCLHATLLGVLAGVDGWTQYGALMVIDAAIRVAVAVCAFLLGWGLDGYLWATVAGSMSWLLVLASSQVARRAAGIRTRGTTKTFLAGASHSITAATTGTGLSQRTKPQPGA